MPTAEISVRETIELHLQPYRRREGAMVRSFRKTFSCRRFEPNLAANRRNLHRRRWAVHRAVPGAEPGSVSSDLSETARLAPLHRPGGLSVPGPSQTPLQRAAIRLTGPLRTTQALVPA